MIDPSMARAAVVAAYLLAALLAARLATAPGRSDQRLWMAAAVVLAALAADRQFVVLNAVTDAARAAAVDAGWYDDRRLFQRWLVLGIGAAGLLAYVAWLRRQRPLSLGSAAMAAAVLFLVCRARARAASQHRVDVFLRAPAAFGLRWQPALELLGAALAAIGAATAMGGVRRRGSAQRLPNPPG
jgi:hypothetical protein